MFTRTDTRTPCLGFFEVWLVKRHLPFASFLFEDVFNDLVLLRLVATGMELICDMGMSFTDRPLVMEELVFEDLQLSCPFSLLLIRTLLIILTRLGLRLFLFAHRFGRSSAASFSSI